MAQIKNKILVVDDEEGLRALVATVLQMAGYEVATAVDGEDGVQKALQYLPDLILLDIMMPKLDGWKTLSKLRTYDQTEHIPIIMLTARGETDSLFKSEQLKVLDYFIKPFEMDEILTYIKKYFDTKELKNRAGA